MIGILLLGCVLLLLVGTFITPYMKMFEFENTFLNKLKVSVFHGFLLWGVVFLLITPCVMETKLAVGDTELVNVKEIYKRPVSDFWFDVYGKYKVEHQLVDEK